jgi:hypothetical protein
MSTPIYCNDSIFRLDYNLRNINLRFPLNQVGPGGYATMTDVDYVYSGNAADILIYCDPDSGNDSTGNGLSGTPYQTPLVAANNCTDEKPYVGVVGTQDLDLSGLSAGISNDYFSGMLNAGSGTVRYIFYALDFTPSDSNTVYVNTASGSDANDGTAALPVATIDTALNICSGGPDYILITDSENYTIAGTIIPDYCAGIYAQVGQTPSITLVKMAGNIASLAITGSAINGTIESYQYGTACLDNDHIISTYTYITDGWVHDDIANAKFTITSIDGLNIYCEETQVAQWIPDLEWGNLAVSPVVARLDYDTFVLAYGIGDGSLFYPYCGMFNIVKEGLTDPWEIDKAGRQRFIKGKQIASVNVYPFATGNFLILYKRTIDSKLYFQIYDITGSVVKSDTDTGFYHQATAIVNSDDSFVIIGHSQIDSPYKLAFKMYDFAGFLTRDTTAIATSANHTDGLSGILFEDDEWGAIWKDTGLYMKMFNAAGDSLSITAILSNTTTAQFNKQNSVVSINDDVAIIVYLDTSDNTVRSSVVGSDGNIYAESINLAQSAADYKPCVNVLKNGTSCYVSYNNASGYVCISPLDISLTWNGLTPSAAFSLGGIKIDGNDSPYLYNIINTEYDFNANCCEFTGATYQNDYVGVFGCVAACSGSTVILNSIVRDNMGGVYAVTNALSVLDNDIYRNTIGYGVSLSGAGASIMIDHNDFVRNAAGINLIDNNGLEDINHNIFYSNDIYDIAAEAAVSVAYSDMTGTSLSVTKAATVINESPLFIADALTDEYSTDHRLMSSIMDDIADSPVGRTTFTGTISKTTDDGRDIGCHDVRIGGLDNLYDTAYITKPIQGILVEYEPSGKYSNQMIDGSYSSGFEGWGEKVTIEYNNIGILNADAAEILSAITTGGKVRFGGDPTTYPSNINEYTVLYDNIKYFARNYRLNRTGKEGLKIILGRKHE